MNDSLPLPQDFSLQNLQEIFTFPFKDPRWKEKMLIAALVALGSMIVPILPLILLVGYCERIMRRMIQEGAAPALPEWDNLGDMFWRGFKVSAAWLIYTLPLIFLMIFAYTTMMLPAFMAPAIERGGAEELLPAMFVGMFTGWAVFGLAMILTLITGMLAPVAVAHLVAKDDFAAAFRVKEWWAVLRANLGGFVIAFILMMGAFMLMSLAMQVLYLTIVLCCLLPFASGVVNAYLLPVVSALYAQAYRAAVQKMPSSEL